MTWDMFSLDRVASGRVVDHRGIVDWIDMLDKIGMLPPAPGTC